MSLTVPASTPDARNRSLQGLRGLAAGLVLIFHVFAMGAHGGFWPDLPREHWVHDVGPLAVRIFFLISGYLIVGSLWRNGDLKRFAWNRVLRLYPVFLLLHVLMFTLGPVIGYQWVGGVAGDSMSRLLGDPLAWTVHFFSNLLFLPGIFALPIAQQNAWSLSYEALFYLVAGMMFLLWKTRQQSHRAIGWWVGWAAIISFSIYDNDGWFFLGGVGVWWLQKQGRLNWIHRGPVDVIALGLGFWLFHLQQYLPATLVLGVFFILVVREQGWLRVVLRSDTMNFLGLISYSLYLVHPFALEALRRLLHPVQNAALTPWAFWVAGLGLAVVSAWLSYECIEKRFTAWLGSKLELRKADLAAKSASDLMATR
jgi:peptidoglycan/LPS O-acetylase OafA/YrhL